MSTNTNIQAMAARAIAEAEQDGVKAPVDGDIVDDLFGAYLPQIARHTNDIVECDTSASGMRQCARLLRRVAWWTLSAAARCESEAMRALAAKGN